MNRRRRNEVTTLIVSKKDQQDLHEKIGERLEAGGRIETQGHRDDRQRMMARTYLNGLGHDRDRAALAELVQEEDRQRPDGQDLHDREGPDRQQLIRPKIEKDREQEQTRVGELRRARPGTTNRRDGRRRVALIDRPP